MLQAVLEAAIGSTSGFSEEDVIGFLELSLPVEWGGLAGASAESGLDADLVRDLFSTLDVEEAGVLQVEQVMELADAFLSVAGGCGGSAASASPPPPPPPPDTLARTYLTRLRFYSRHGVSSMRATATPPTAPHTHARPAASTTSTTATAPSRSVEVQTEAAAAAPKSMPYKHWVEGGQGGTPVQQPLQYSGAAEAATAAAASAAAADGMYEALPTPAGGEEQHRHGGEAAPLCLVAGHQVMAESLAEFLALNLGGLRARHLRGVAALAPEMRSRMDGRVRAMRMWCRGYLRVSAALRFQRAGKLHVSRADSFDEGAATQGGGGCGGGAMYYIPDARLREGLREFLAHTTAALEKSPHSVRVTRTFAGHLQTLASLLRYPQRGQAVGDAAAPGWTPGTPRHTERRLNVRRYGVAGGARDDTRALSRALAAASEMGAEVYFPKGHYTFQEMGPAV